MLVPTITLIVAFYLLALLTFFPPKMYQPYIERVSQLFLSIDLPPMIVPAFISLLLFLILGILLGRISDSHFFRFTGIFIFSFAAIPGLGFLLYYTGLIPEFAWFLEWRAHPAADLVLGGVGLLTGFVISSSRHDERGSIALTRAVMLLGSFMIVLYPFINHFFFPFNSDTLHDNWTGRTCMQTSPKTGSVCCVATLLQNAGFDASEQVLAEELFTSGRGTEPWKLALALRDRGLNTRFDQFVPPLGELPVPSIAWVYTVDSQGQPYTVTLLYRSEDAYLVSDPREGNILSCLLYTSDAADE